MPSARTRWYRIMVLLVMLSGVSLASATSAFASQVVTTTRHSTRGSTASSVRIDSSETVDVQEPAPSGVDDQGNSYSDNNFSQNCGPGASTVALSFWQNFVPQGLNPYSMTPGGQITFWGDTHFHSYIMYMATEISIPASAAGGAQNGEIRYNGRVSLGTDSQDLANALNSSIGQNFYFRQLIGPNDAALVHNDIVSDLTDTNQAGSLGSGVAPIVELQATYLPDWHSGPVNHFVAIVGYNDSTSQYSYVETCGPSCGGTFGFHTISQAQLFQGILHVKEGPQNDDRALIW